LVTLNGLLPHEELEIPRHPGEEHMEKMILHQLEASPGLGLGWEWGIWSFCVWGEKGSSGEREEERVDGEK